MQEEFDLLLSLLLLYVIWEEEEIMTSDFVNSSCQICL